MDVHLPGILVTGASGFIGRNFIEASRTNYRLFCLARRSQNEAGVPKHKNLLWIQVDIAKWDTFREAVKVIKDHGGVDYVLHLAGYYDFSNKWNDEYQRTNVKGTHNVLKLAKLLGIKRFIFSSSLAACEFPPVGESVSEDYPPDADFPYAWSKRKGEKLIKEHQEWFPCTIVRLAAVYSDWCEYPPLYIFLTTWLTRNWKSKIIGGRGKSAVTYLHIHDLIRLFFQIIEKSKTLPRYSIYNASPNQPTSHLELFRSSTRYYYGQENKPLRIPKLFAVPFIFLRQLFGGLVGKPPFEVLWMMKYIDQQLNVNANNTYTALSWNPTSRYLIERRLLFMIENMKSHSDVWHTRNQAALNRETERPNFLIYEILIELKEDLIDNIFNHITSVDNIEQFRNYYKMDRDYLKWYIRLIYQLIANTVRSGDRVLLRNYARIIAHRRFMEKFNCDQVCNVLLSIEKIISNTLRDRNELIKMQQRVYDHITMSFQLAIDEVRDTFEMLDKELPDGFDMIEEKIPMMKSADLELIIHGLEDIGQEILDRRVIDIPNSRVSD